MRFLLVLTDLWQLAQICKRLMLFQGEIFLPTWILLRKILADVLGHMPLRCARFSELVGNP